MDLSLERTRAMFAKYRWVLIPLAVFVITRSAIWVGGVAGRLALQDLIASGPPQSSVLIEIWDRWDSGFYRSIATEGYSFESTETYSNVAFFPLYPLLMRMALPVLGDAALAGVLISHLCLLLALIVLYRLVLFEQLGEATARRTILYLSVFPMAFFFGAIYTESAFLMFAVGCVYFARRRWWLAAALFGMAASATRIVGIALYGVLLIEWWLAYGGMLRDRSARSGWLRGELGRVFGALALIQLSAAGLLLYMLYLQNRFGNPLLFMDVQAAWGRLGRASPFGFFTGLADSLMAIARGQLGMAYVATEAMLGLLGLALAPLIWRRYGPGYALYTLLCFLPAVMSGRIASTIRFTVVAFPLFMLLAEFGGRHSLLHDAILVGFCIMLGVFFMIFVNGGWVA